MKTRNLKPYVRRAHVPDTPESTKIKDFTARFLMALEQIPIDARDPHSGSRYHPLKRKVLLRECKYDLEHYGIDETIEKWRYFIE